MDHHRDSQIYRYYGDQLQTAIENGNLKRVKELLKHKEALESLGGARAIRIAVQNDNLEIVQELRKYKSVDVKILEMASVLGKLRIIEEVFKDKTSLSSLNIGWAVRNAVVYGHMQVLDCLLKRMKRFDDIEEILLEITDEIAEQRLFDNDQSNCLRRLLSDTRIRQWLQNRDDAPVLLKSALNS